MGFNDSLTEFAGLEVIDWSDDAAIDFDRHAVRLRLDYDEADDGVTLPSKLAGLLDTDGVERLKALVIGAWTPTDSGGDSSEIVEALVAARAKLPALRHLFFGDIISEENEVSWIVQSDFAPLLAAYNTLEHLTVRGTISLSLGRVDLPRLRELVIQTGGLPPELLPEIFSARLPNLERLELYLGTDEYGGDVKPDDLAPLLRGELFPNLRYLGLKNSIIADDIAAAVADAPVLDRLYTLDLSLGTLGDDGAKALLASARVRKLKKLDLHYHFISEPVAEQLQGLAINVDLSDRQDADEYDGKLYRYVAVSE